MAFVLNGIMIDRLVEGVATGSAGMLYVLKNLQDVSITTTANTKEKQDAQGNTIRTFYTGKTGNLEGNNVFLDLAVLGETTGSGLELASATKKLKVPFIQEYTTSTANATVEGIVEGTLQIVGIDANGTILEKYTKDTTAAKGKYALAANKITFPTEVEDGVLTFLVKCEREVTSGGKVTDSSNKFPKSCELLLKGIVATTCEEDTRVIYIKIPRFLVSPEVNLTFSTDSTMPFSGKMEVNYCSTDKELYSIYYAEDEVGE